MTVKSPDSLVTSIATSNRFESIVGLLTLSSVVLALVLYIPEIELSTSQNNAIYIFDLGVVAVLAFDFVIRIKASKKGIKYVIRHFYEIPAMIPLIAFAMFEDPLIIGAAVRSIRFVRMLRLLRLFRLANLFRTAQHWKLNTFLYLATILAASVIFGAIAIYFVEVEETGKTITDLEDALWFAVTTITISGFGDVYPISTAGRLVAAILSFIEQQHLERMDTCELMLKLHWQNYWEEKSAYRRSLILREIRDLQHIVSAYYDSTRSVLKSTASGIAGGA